MPGAEYHNPLRVEPNLLLLCERGVDFVIRPGDNAPLPTVFFSSFIAPGAFNSPPLVLFVLVSPLDPSALTLLPAVARSTDRSVLLPADSCA